ncbi:hypothetical protein VNI00_017326 [Paramarasmius palmivorus]|uniref:Uncharacterized protein n=1 Tax=Paramarasmius palmivorus TaxID=297713 RepID=A0AAW0B5M1_9AGAR
MLPPPSTTLHKYPVSVSVINVDSMLCTAQSAGKWVEHKSVRNLYLVGRVYQHLNAPIPDTCNHIILSRYQHSTWIHNTSQTHEQLFMNDEHITFAWSFEDAPSIPKTTFLDPPASQAAWLTLYSNPTQFPGIAIATDLSVDLTTIPGHDFYQQLRPCSVTETGYCTSLEHRHHFLYMMVYLLSQVALYEQLVLHYKVTINSSVSHTQTQPFDGNLAPHISLEELVNGMAQRGVTFAMAHDVHAWAISCLNDLFILYPEMEPQLQALLPTVSE